MNKTLRGLTVAALALSTLALNPLGAWAHDEVEGTNPKSQTTVAAGVFDVSVTFGEDIMAIPDGVGNAIVVSGPGTDGDTVWSNGCSTVDGSVLSTPVDLDKPGTYRVVWRAVSSDGHANEGSFSFTLENKTGYQSSGLVEVTPECQAAQDEPLVAPAPNPNAAGVGQATDINEKADTGMDPNLIGLFVGIAFVVVGSVAGALVTDRRNRKAHAKPKEPTQD
ncbi:MAG: copper resistance protein CopC [Micrococcales bacterium]